MMTKDDLQSLIIGVKDRIEKIDFNKKSERYLYEYYSGLLVAYGVCWKLVFNETYDEFLSKNNK